MHLPLSAGHSPEAHTGEIPCCDQGCITPVIKGTILTYQTLLCWRVNCNVLLFKINVTRHTRILQTFSSPSSLNTSSTILCLARVFMFFISFKENSLFIKIWPDSIYHIIQLFPYNNCHILRTSLPGLLYKVTIFCGSALLSSCYWLKMNCLHFTKRSHLRH